VVAEKGNGEKWREEERVEDCSRSQIPSYILPNPLLLFPSLLFPLFLLFFLFSCSSEKKTKKKSSSSSSGGSRKKLESSLGSSADFEKSYESSVEVNSPRENVAKAQHLDAVAAAEHTMVKPASAKLAYQQLEEFAELDELEGIVDHGGGWGAEVGGEERAKRGGGEGERRKKGANRVSLVRSSRAGDGFVAPDPHRIVRTGW